jgi:hypothetical protein
MPKIWRIGESSVEIKVDPYEFGLGVLVTWWSVACFVHVYVGPIEIVVQVERSYESTLL